MPLTIGRAITLLHEGGIFQHGPFLDLVQKPAHPRVTAFLRAKTRTGIRERRPRENLVVRMAKRRHFSFLQHIELRFGGRLSKVYCTHRAAPNDSLARIALFPDSVVGHRGVTDDRRAG